MLVSDTRETKPSIQHRWRLAPAVSLMCVLEFSREDEWTCRADNTRFGLLCDLKLFADVRTKFEICHNMGRLNHELRSLLDMIREEVLPLEPSVPSALVLSRLPNASARVVATSKKVEAIHDRLLRCRSRDV